MIPDNCPPGAMHRVCDSCFDETNASVPGRLRGPRIESVAAEARHLSVPGSEASSVISDLAE
jgi:hypothetical protein